MDVYLGTLRATGIDGSGWSGTSHSDVRYAYAFHLGFSDVYPSGSSNSYAALPVQNFIHITFTSLYLCAEREYASG